MSQGVPLTRFAEYLRAVTEDLTAQAKRLAAEADRPYVYLEHATTRNSGQTKEHLARTIAARDQVSEGLVCVLSAVESCWSFQVRGERRTHELNVIRRQRKCVHHYFYFIDPEFGFMHIRLQAWLPYDIQIYVNGREWLARQLDAAAISYLRYDNALLRIETSRRPRSSASASPTGPGPGC